MPFRDEHLEPAADLLANRHRRNRERDATLPVEYEDPAKSLPIIRDLFATDGKTGVVAVKDESVVGYLMGSRDYRSPTSAFACFVQPRAASIPYAGFATVPGESGAIYHRMYASLAQRWVAEGVTTHYVTAPACGDACETWSTLGFGQFAVLAARSTSPVNARQVDSEWSMEVRRASEADVDVVQAMVTELFRTFADPPIFLPYLAESATERRQFISEHLADPGCSYWLAMLHNRVVGLQIFEEPHSAQWHQPVLATPPGSLYLLFAYITPDARGKGVGAAFVQRTMTWARETGYDTCLLHYLAASRAAAFWSRLGFRPIAEWRRRSIDERAIWANGDATTAAT